MWDSVCMPWLVMRVLCHVCGSKIITTWSRALTTTNYEYRTPISLHFFT
jgi:hypothetical protein